MESDSDDSTFGSISSYEQPMEIIVGGKFPWEKEDIIKYYDTQIEIFNNRLSNNPYKNQLTCINSHLSCLCS